MIKTIIFDFDGVIINSYDATITYMKETLSHFDKPVPARKDFEGLLGLKTRDIVTRILPKGTDEYEIEEIYEFSKQKSLEAVPLIKLIPNAASAVKELAETYQLGIASSRAERTLTILLEKFALDTYFQVVITREDVSNHKPHPEPILKALEQIGDVPRNSIYIGDMEEDILAAKAGNITSVLVGSGNASYGADHFIPSVADLPELMETIIDR